LSDIGGEDPGNGTFDRSLEVLGEAAASTDPGESALDDPAALDKNEAFGVIGSLDDLDRPVAEPAQGLAQLVASVAAVGEDVAEPRVEIADPLERENRTVAVSTSASCTTTPTRWSSVSVTMWRLRPLIFLPAS
jgi:hypothetical protein